MNDFYVYTHTRNDTGDVFYVGKGMARRAWSHKNRNPHWKRIVAKHGYEVSIHSEGLSEVDAFNSEKILISKYRNDGFKLVNMTDGGDGVAGFVPTEDQRQRNSDAQKAIFATDEGRARITRMNEIRFSDPKIMETAVTRRTETMRTPEYRKKRSELAKIQASRPGERERLRQIAIAANASDESRAANAARLRAHYSSQEARDANAASHGTKKFICLQNGKTYQNMSQAAKELGINVGHLHQILRGHGKTAKGYSFQYVQETAVIE